MVDLDPDCLSRGSSREASFQIVLSFCLEWLCFFTISFSAHHRATNRVVVWGRDFIGNVGPNLSGHPPPALKVDVLEINSLNYAIYVLL
jgi:hypothetical protein